VAQADQRLTAEVGDQEFDVFSVEEFAEFESQNVGSGNRRCVLYCREEGPDVQSCGRAISHAPSLGARRTLDPQPEGGGANFTLVGQTTDRATP
jgi:hypothetical protein